MNINYQQIHLIYFHGNYSKIFIYISFNPNLSLLNLDFLYYRIKKDH